MATTVWKGHLTFGLVSIPVRLFKAARAEKISFHRLRKVRHGVHSITCAQSMIERAQTMYSQLLSWTALLAAVAVAGAQPYSIQTVAGIAAPLQGSATAQALSPRTVAVDGS